MMHLVDDEVTPFRCCNRDSDFRVRIWRARDRVPVVLVSVESPAPWPMRLTTKAADLAYGPMLGYPSTGMHYYERDGDGYYRVTFGFSGNAHRLAHAEPRRARVGRGEIEAMIGAKIED